MKEAVESYAREQTEEEAEQRTYHCRQYLKSSGYIKSAAYRQLGYLMFIICFPL